MFKFNSNKLSSCELKSHQSIYTRDWLNTLQYEGFALDSDRYGYTYSIQEASMNTDPFVRKALKQFDPVLYEDCRGWTKRVDFTVGLEDLKGYDVPQMSFDNIKNDPRALLCWNRAIEVTREVFVAKEPLKRLHIDDVHKVMAGSTSAGFSFPNQKKHDVIEEASEIANYMKHMLKNDKRVYSPPCKLGFRGHLSPEDEQKVRPVWVYPAEMTYLESCFSHPYYEYVQENVDPVFFGEGTFPRLRKRLTEKLNGRLEISSDWRRFDKLAPNFVIDEAFEMIRDSFDQDFASSYRLDGTSKEKQGDNGWTRVFNYLKSYFKYTRIMLPDGSVLKKLGGVPSGSMWTQMIDTIVNYLVVTFLCLYFDIDLSDLCVLGDDSHFRSYNFKVYDFIAGAKAFFGMVSHPEKMKINEEDSNSRSFLGYTFNGHMLWRPEKEWFLRVLYSERDVENLGVSASRVLGLLLVGGCNSELFTKFYVYYMRAYPVEGREFTLSVELNRMFKYVFRTTLNIARIPMIAEIDWFAISSFLLNGVSVLTTRRV